MILHHARHGGAPVAFHVGSTEERARSPSGAVQQQAQLDVVDNRQTQRFVAAARAVGGRRAPG